MPALGLPTKTIKEDVNGERGRAKMDQLRDFNATAIRASFHYPRGGKESLVGIPSTFVDTSRPEEGGMRG